MPMLQDCVYNDILLNIENDYLTGFPNDFLADDTFTLVIEVIDKMMKKKSKF